MATYRVVVCRTAHGFREFTVQASSEQEARERALGQAGNYVFSDKTSEYEVEDLERLPAETTPNP